MDSRNMSVVEEYLLLAENARREASLKVSVAQRIELVRMAEAYESKARELHGFGLGRKASLSPFLAR